VAWAPDYVEVTELAEFVHIDDDVDDDQLALAVTTSSRAVDRHCRRQFGLVDAPVVRTYSPRYSCSRGWLLDIDDLMTTTDLLVDGVAPATPVLYPRNAAADGKPWTALALSSTPSGDVEVTARWGWSTVPDAVKEATLLQASRLFARRGAPFGVAGSPDTGSEIRLLAKVDPDVAVSLGDYQRRARPR
jgi:hypothetical protein